MTGNTSSKSISLYDNEIVIVEEEMQTSLTAFVRGQIERIQYLEEESIDLKAMWNAQEDFNKQTDFGVISDRFEWDVEYDSLTDFQKTQLTQRFILKLIDEATEVLEEMSWKDHKPFDPDKLSPEDHLEEMIDIQKFLFCMAQVWGFTPEEWETKFFEKTKKVKRSHPKYDANQKQVSDYAKDEE